MSKPDLNNRQIDDSKGIDPSFSRIQKAAELLNIKKFSQAAPTPSPTPGATPNASKEPAPAENERADHTVARPAAQAAAATAEPSLPSDYAELKRQALAKAKAQMPAESRLALAHGSELQEYRIEWTLGVGGFGVTYLAVDTNLEMQVAIKEYFPSDLVVREAGGKVRPKQQEDEEAFLEGRDKFLTECRTLAKFNHPNVVKVSRFFQMNDTAYMVMNYESGCSLKEWLGKQARIDEKKLLGMFMPLLDGLDVVHKAGFLHRDIKPANIFVRQDDSLVLLDFGAARHAIGNKSLSLTTIVTPGYAPFEQYHSHGKQGPWTDIYALGGVLYWIATGNKPVEAPARIKSDGMAPASQAAAGRFSPSILAAIDWALSSNESHRPQSITELKTALTAPTPVQTGVRPRMPDQTKSMPPAAPATAAGKKAWWKLGK